MMKNRYECTILLLTTFLSYTKYICILSNIRDSQPKNITFLHLLLEFTSIRRIKKHKLTLIILLSWCACRKIIFAVQIPSFYFGLLLPLLTFSTKLHMQIEWSYSSLKNPFWLKEHQHGLLFGCWGEFISENELISDLLPRSNGILFSYPLFVHIVYAQGQHLKMLL